MKEYATLHALKQDFVSGNFIPNEPVKVGEIEYNTGHTSSHQRFSDLVCESNKGVVVYSGPKDNNWLMFLWGANKNSIIPYDVRTTTQPITEKEELEQRVIADKIEVAFLNMPVSSSLVAKVDTGAEMNSLNATDVQINRQDRTVTFVAPELSRNTIKMSLADQQQVKTSGGETTYRAVISVTLKIKGKVLKDQLVNLNDRSEMQDPMLLGQNALQAGNFLIDPNIIKEADDLLTPEFLASLKHDSVEAVSTLNEETTQRLYEVLEQVGDVSLSSLITALRTQVLKNVDDITY